jgi:hypothetical protein
MKRALIFTSHVGGGHDTVAAAVSSLLQSGDHYTCVRVDIYDLIGTIPSISRWLPLPLTAIYNDFVLKRGCTGILWTGLVVVLRCALALFKRRISNEVAACIRSERADLVVSVLPMVNEIIGDAVKKTGDLPFVTIVVDLSEVFRGTWIQHAQQRVVCFSDPIYRAALLFGIPRERICKLAAPIVPSDSFSEMTESRRAICRQEYGIDGNRRVALVSFGAEGAGKMTGYVDALMRNTKVFAICLCGRNKQVFQKLVDVVPRSRGVVLEFTDNYLELFRIADFLITKPGSLTVWQAVLLRRPMLLELNRKTLIHERYTGTWAIQTGVGFGFSDWRSLVRMVHKMECLSDSSWQEILHRFEVFSRLDENELRQQLFCLIDYEQQCSSRYESGGAG